MTSTRFVTSPPTGRGVTSTGVHGVPSGVEVAKCYDDPYPISAILSSPDGKYGLPADVGEDVQSFLEPMLAYSTQHRASSTA